MPPLRAVLRVICADRPGLVADVSGLLFRLGANILHADQHIDSEEGTFFQRIEFTPPPLDGDAARDRLAAHVGRACDGFGMRWSLGFREPARRMAILCSKRGHCVLDLLQRHRAGDLSCEVAIVLSNHDDLRLEVERRGYRFVHEPIANQGDRASQERRLLERLASERVDLVVLARYMQILSPGFVDAYKERLINIHHSFLPAFAGADPYRQAFRRGVKLIGATSHYVTRDLDEGPIISQDVARVTHRDSVEDMMRKGADLERVVLAHAVRCHLEDRIICYGNKTVVFE